MRIDRPGHHLDEQVTRAVPRGATAWTQALQAREHHRLLIPVERAEDGEIALRYVVTRLAPSVASVHLVNVQPGPVAEVDGCARVDGPLEQRLELVKAERMLASVRSSVECGTLRVTRQVAFGSPAEKLCTLAQPQRFSGIVVGRRSFSLDDFIGRSTIAKILQLARVPVTFVQRRTTAGNAPRERVRAALPQRRGATESSSQATEESLA